MGWYRRRSQTVKTKKTDEFVRFTWEENDDESYFEMRIIVDEITKDVSLFITDFAEEDEVEEAKMLWENQVSELKTGFRFKIKPRIKHLYPIFGLDFSRLFLWSILTDNLSRRNQHF